MRYQQDDVWQAINTNGMTQYLMLTRKDSIKLFELDWAVNPKTDILYPEPTFSLGYELKFEDLNPPPSQESKFNFATLLSKQVLMVNTFVN